MRCLAALLLLLAGCGSDPLELLTESLPEGSTGAPYSAQMMAQGGKGDLTWSVRDGMLPAGVSLAGDGALSGTPTEVGAFNVTIQVRDEGDQSDGRSYSISIRDGGPPALVITTMDLLDGIIDEPYDRTVAAMGGTGDYSWSISSGALPPGITLEGAGTPAARVSGTPTMAGDFTFAIEVADQDGMTASKTFTLTIQEKMQMLFAIRSFLLPDGAVGQPYTADLQVENATGDVVWTIDDGDFPPGLMLARDGTPNTTVTGTPTADGLYTFTIRAVDEDGDSDSREFEVTIAPTFVPINLETTDVPTATVGVPYSAPIVARNGTGTNFGWTVDGGALPPGLMLQAQGTPDTVVNGIPTMRGTYTATITVRDSNGDTAARELTWQVADPILEIVTPDLPTGDQGSPYNAPLTAIGGAGSGYVWQIVGGSLPPGLALQPSTNTATVLNGTPAAIGTYSFTVQITDGSQTATADYTVQIYPPLTIVTGQQLPQAQVFLTYTATLAATGGSGGYTFAVTQGALPPGLTLDPSGDFLDVPLQPGTFNFTVTVTDDRGRTADRAFTLEVFAPPPVIVTPALPGAGQGQPYVAGVTATGGAMAGYAWTVESGALPPGLNITPMATPTATVSGQATTVGSYGFTLRVTDAFGGSATQAYTIDVLPALQIQTAVVPGRTECGSQRDLITASGGSGTGYQWAVVSGPAGLVMEPTGTPSASLVGRATESGTFNLTLQVTDDAGLVTQRSYQLQVTADPNAQRFAAIGGDILVNGRQEVFVINVCGDAPGPLVPASRPFTWTGGAPTVANPLPVQFSPANARLAFIGDYLTNGVEELFLTTVTGTGAVSADLRINGLMVGGGDVASFAWAANSNLIAYLADQNTDGTNELFVVDVTTPLLPSPAVQVSATAPVVSYTLSPDSSGLVYTTEVAGTRRHYYVDLTNPAVPGAPLSIHPTLGAGQSCVGAVRWEPTGASAIYRCDHATAGVNELWFVRFPGGIPTTPQRVNGALTAGGDVYEFNYGYSPDGAGIAYLADQDVNDTREVYLSAIFGTTIIPGFRVMPPLSAGANANAIVFASDSVRGLVQGDLDTDEVFELYLIDSSGGFPATPVKVNGTLVAGGDVSIFGFSPDDNSVAYVADQTINDRREVFVANVMGAAPWPVVRASPALGGAGTEAFLFQFSPDSARVATRGDFATDNVNEVAVAAVSAPAPVVLNDPGQNIPLGSPTSWRADSDGFFYIADGVGRVSDVSGPARAAPVSLHGAPAGGLGLILLEP